MDSPVAHAERGRNGGVGIVPVDLRRQFLDDAVPFGELLLENFLLTQDLRLEISHTEFSDAQIELQTPDLAEVSGTLLAELDVLLLQNRNLSVLFRQFLGVGGDQLAKVSFRLDLFQLIAQGVVFRMQAVILSE